MNEPYDIMRTDTVESLHRRYAVGPRAHLDSAKWTALRETIQMCDERNAFVFPAGTKFKAWVTQNFGWVIFEPIRYPDGSVPAKRLFKQ